MTTPANGTTPRYRFADLTLDAAERRVTRLGHPLELSGLTFDLLRVLVESAPNVVTYDDLAEKVWARHFVSPENVAQRVMLLRQALSDDASRPRYLEAVRSRGYRLIPRVEPLPAPGEEPIVLAIRTRRRTVEYSLVGLVLIAAAWVLYRVELDSTPSVPPAVDLASSIAVLPLDNLSAEPDKVFVAVGLHEEILNHLEKIPGLTVIARNSVLPYAQSRPPIPQIARALGVGSIMTGSVRFAGDDLRVTMELVDAATEALLWSETYDRRFGDIFAIETDIGANVARALRAELAADEQERILRQASATSFEAYELYLAARGFATEGIARSDTVLELLDRAVSIDPTFVQAWVEKAEHHSVRAGLVADRVDEEHRSAIEAATRAIELDPSGWPAHKILAFVLANRGEWLTAEAERRKAVELGMPLSAAPGSGVLMEVGDFAAAREAFIANLRIDPMNSYGAGFLLAAHEMAGDSAARRAGYERGETLYGDWLGDAMELLLRLGDRDEEFLRAQDFSVDTTFVWGSDRLIHLTGQRHLDAPEAGRAALRALFADKSHASAGSLIRLAAWAAHFGDAELALHALREATLQQPSRVWYVWLPVFEAVRAEPEFKDLIRDLGLVEYWRRHGWAEFCRPVGGDDFTCRGTE